MDLRIEIPLREIVAKAMRCKTEILIGCGVITRVAEYLWNRHYWMDELSLAGVIRKTWGMDLFGPLAHTQLAPVGFLAIERLVYQFLGDRPLSLRLLPLIGALVSLWLFRRVAERSLTPRAALLALGMFAFSDDLIYFAAELKPYSTDVTISLLCLWIAQKHLGARGVSIGLLATLGFAPWFSFPSAFVLAGVGVVLWVAAALKRSWGEVLGLSGVGIIWIFSIAGAQWVARRQLGDPRGMYVFWNFAFPADPGNPSSTLVWALRRFTYLFANPLDFSMPGLGTTAPALFTLGLFLVGCVSMARRDKQSLGLLTLPLLLAMFAGYARLYPFHGRLVLFLVPSLFIVIAEGAGCLARIVEGRAAWIVLAGFLVGVPALTAVYYVAEPSRDRIFNPLGDRRPVKLVAESFPR